MEYMNVDILQQVQISQKFITLMRDKIQLLEPQKDEEDMYKYKVGLGCP